jgi:uncharacterized protein
MSNAKKRQVACPNCGQFSEFSPSNPFRPFCCERCKLIDLGLWASEQYAIPVAAKDDELNEQHLND